MSKEKAPSQNLASLLSDMVSSYQQPVLTAPPSPPKPVPVVPDKQVAAEPKAQADDGEVLEWQAPEVPAAPVSAANTATAYTAADDGLDFVLFETVADGVTAGVEADAAPAAETEMRQEAAVSELFGEAEGINGTVPAEAAALVVEPQAAAPQAVADIMPDAVSDNLSADGGEPAAVTAVATMEPEIPAPTLPEALLPEPEEAASDAAAVAASEYAAGTDESVAETVVAATVTVVPESAVLAAALPEDTVAPEPVAAVPPVAPVTAAGLPEAAEPEGSTAEAAFSPAVATPATEPSVPAVDSVLAAALASADFSLDTEPAVNSTLPPEQPHTSAATQPETHAAQEGLAAPVYPHPLLEKMAVESLRLKASDIFISTGFAPAFKIDGSLTPAPVHPLSREEAAKIVYSTMNAAQQSKFAHELELNYSLQAKNGVRFRVNAYHEQGRIGMVLRRLTTEIATVDDLFLPQALKDLAMKPRGLIILAGATGSGKSTSMAAMIDWRNEHQAGHIVTIEDPIEYIHQPKKSIVTHREVGIDTLSWSNAVQSAMRQAPDVVCVGEVRNEQSLEYAMQLAQTGHLCFFTIHASNASQAVERILNFYPEEQHKQVLMDLALNLVCIIGQRLVVKKGGKGRRAIVDLLINTPAMQDYIFKGELMEMKALMNKAEQDGMQTFDQDLFDLYCEEVIDYDEALRQADSVNDLRLRIKLYEEGRASGHIFDRVGDLNLL